MRYGVAVGFEQSLALCFSVDDGTPHVEIGVWILSDPLPRLAALCRKATHARGCWSLACSLTVGRMRQPFTIFTGTHKSACFLFSYAPAVGDTSDLCYRALCERMRAYPVLHHVSQKAYLCIILLARGLNSITCWNLRRAPGLTSVCRVSQQRLCRPAPKPGWWRTP